jgi:beta-galactosidase
MLCQWGQVAADHLAVRVKARLAAPDQAAGFDSEVTYHIYGSGVVEVKNEVRIDEGLPFVPRVGMEMRLSADLALAKYYGRGPFENYVDRKKGALVGRYEISVQEQAFPYIHTSEFGGREDVRWLELCDEAGVGVKYVGRDVFHFDALPYSTEQLAEAEHPYNLHPLDEVVLHIDGFHMGVGGDDGWMPRNVHPEFRIPPGRYSYGFAMKPVG